MSVGDGTMLDTDADADEGSDARMQIAALA
jgi:hypothetical protein